MKTLLFAWIGDNDLKARLSTEGSRGPILRVLENRAFDHIVLLNNWKDRPADVKAYVDWVKSEVSVSLSVRDVELPSPTHYEGIYQEATAAVGWAQKEFGENSKLTFHLSPGTGAMLAVWILIAPSYRATLIQASRQGGVEDASIPFHITADFVEPIARRADENLAKVADGLRPELPKFGDILFKSEAMAALVKKAKKLLNLSATVLIEGESGTGKELLARAIHHEGARKAQAFRPINCGAIAPNLIEAELFGYEKGAFTGAEKAKKGIFEDANEGTVFLDEIGELPADAQVKLLRVLQEKRVRRVGGTTEIPVDVRVIAATHRDLRALVEKDKFREDLYFRLAVLVLQIPSLRERTDDLAMLCDHFLLRLNQDTAPALGVRRKNLSAEGRKRLVAHRWSGNIRELETVLLRAFVWADGDVIGGDDIDDALRVGATVTGDILGRPIGTHFKLEDVLLEVEKHYLTRALDRAGGSPTRAAPFVGFTNKNTFKTRFEKATGTKLKAAASGTEE